MTTPHESSLGREVAYPTGYDPSLLFPIPRAGARAELGLAAGAALPFTGHDRWHAYELGWLDGRGKPQVATATVQVPADSPNLVESKSFKLYLNSLNGARLDSAEALRARIAADLSLSAGAPVAVVYPEAVWYTYLDLSDIDEIVESHLKNGQVVERLLTPPHLGR